MGIRELKAKIQNKSTIKNLIIFRLPEDKNLFLVNQYIDAIANLNNKEILYIEDYSSLINSNIFSDEPNYIRVCKIDEFNSINKKLIDIQNLIIIANRISINTETIFSDYITNIPKLEEWQLKAYVETKLEGVKQNNIDNFFNSYKDNIDKLVNETAKISVFPNEYKNYIVENLDKKYSGNIFNLINGLVKKDINNVDNSLRCLNEIEPMGFLTLLYNNIKNIINIQLNSRATPQSLNMNPKQFNAIKYNIGYYNKEELVNIFELLTSIDYKIKNGDLPMDIVVDYIITNILK